MMRLLALAASVALGLAALAPVAGAQEQSASLPDIEDEVMCPICGTALNLSESPQANAQREFIRDLIAEGRTKGEIKDALVDEYGPEVLATPDTSGFDLAAWVIPAAGLILAAVAIGVGVRRWRARDDAGEAERQPAGPAPDDEERLRADLRRYEL